MGDESGVTERIKSATRLSLDLGLMKVGDKLDIRVVTMLIWQSRELPEVVEAISEILASEVAKKEVFNGIEFYLPQLAHMMIHLEVEWPKHVLEQFAYMVSQHSLHFALQMHWFLFSCLQDYQPEFEDGRKNPNVSPELFIRCATLMHGLERAIVYGNVTNMSLEQRYHDGEITKEQLDKLRNLDRLDNAEKISKFAEDEGPMMKGRLMHISPPQKGNVVPKKWKELHMELKFNMLLFYRANGSLKRALPLHHAIVIDPEDPEMTEEEAKLAKDVNQKKFDHYFEIREKNRNKIYRFRSVNKTQRKKWVRLIRQCTNKPPIYEPAEIKEQNLSETQLERFNFYRRQITFVREVTYISEQLRDVEESERKRVLRKSLEALDLVGLIYNPLCKSSDAFAEIVKAVPKKSFPLFSKENVPCLMTFQVTKNSQKLDVANVLHDKFSDDAVAGYFESFSHNILAPMRSIIAGDDSTNLLIKRPSVWNEEEDITSLSAAANLAVEDDEIRFIAKSNDDLRQEVFTMQLLKFLQDTWEKKGLSLFLRPFQILATSRSSGLVEFIPKAKSFHMLKKDIYDKDKREVSLYEGFQETFTDNLEKAQKNYVESLAGYSVATYILAIKNRHNGNIMLDSQGRIIHVDFSFVLGMAPGKNKFGHTNLSVERAAFKLTTEMIDAFGGLESDNHKYFEELCVEGLKAAREHIETLCTLIEIMAYKSTYPCFTQPGGVKQILKDLRARLFDNLTEEQAEKSWKKKIDSARNAQGTLMYEKYQKATNNIFPVH